MMLFPLTCIKIGVLPVNSPHCFFECSSSAPSPLYPSQSVLNRAGSIRKQTDTIRIVIRTKQYVLTIRYKGKHLGTLRI